LPSQQQRAWYNTMLKSNSLQISKIQLVKVRQQLDKGKQLEQLEMPAEIMLVVPLAQAVEILGLAVKT
jgi:hypothetical protein